MNLTYLPLIFHIAEAFGADVPDIEALIKNLESNQPIQQKVQEVMDTLDKVVGSILKAL